MRAYLHLRLEANRSSLAAPPSHRGARALHLPSPRGSLGRRLGHTRLTAAAQRVDVLRVAPLLVIMAVALAALSSFFTLNRYTRI